MNTNILIYPHESLRTTASYVKKVDDYLVKLSNNMIEFLNQMMGMGLAANQINVDKRLIVYNDNKESDLQVLINPEIIYSEGVVISEKEGCLSLPYLRCDVIRHRNIEVVGIDLEEKEKRVVCNGMTSIILQHEIDHLDGVLLIDKISKYRKQKYKELLSKME